MHDKPLDIATWAHPVAYVWGGTIPLSDQLKRRRDVRETCVLLENISHLFYFFTELSLLYYLSNLEKKMDFPTR